MRSSFFGLELGLSGLLAQQKAMDVTGHNIANAHTPGFSRQRLNLSTRPPLGMTSMTTGTGGHIGTGVEAGQAVRLRDQLLDHRYRAVQGKLAEWELRHNVLDQVQHIFGEPSELGIGAGFDRLWMALQELGSHPESIAARRAMIEAGAALSDAINQTHSALTVARGSLDELLRAAVGEVNSVVSELAEVNTLVFKATAQGDNPNDLLDQRDRVLNRLSSLIGITVQTESTGDVTVFCGSHRILDITETRQINLTFAPGGGEASLSWAHSGAEFVPTTGEITGLLAAREEYLPGFISELETMTTAFVDRFNELHREGFGLDGVDGRDFFVSGSTAGTLAVHPDIVNAPGWIAAAGSGEPGDNFMALRLADVRRESIVGGTTVDDFFNSIISRLGTLVQRAEGICSANRNIKLQVEVKREDVSGVSLDEEVTHLLRYQHAYAAAARFISVVDEMLTTLINLGR